MVASVLLVGCGATAQTNQSPYQGLYNQRIDEVQSMAAEVEASLKKLAPQEVLSKVMQNIAYGLKDPDSAKFRNMRFVKYNGRTVVCGEVNSKNSYGGYVGFENFVAGLTSSQAMSSTNYQTTSGSADSAGFRTYCLLGEVFNP
jgi:hypothetical protein